MNINLDLNLMLRSGKRDHGTELLGKTRSFVYKFLTKHTVTRNVENRRNVYEISLLKTCEIIMYMQIIWNLQCEIM